MRSFALIVTAALLAGATPIITACGGEDDGNPSSASKSPSGLGEMEYRRLADLRTHMLGWNNSASAWVKAYEGGDMKQFLRVHNKQVPLLRLAVNGIRNTASQLEHPDLRRLLTASTAKYQAELRLMVKMAGRVRAGDVAAADALVPELRDLAFSADEEIAELRKRFPELSRER